MQPDFFAQTAEPMHKQQRYWWFCHRIDEFRALGATWVQMTVDEERTPEIALIEGWIERPETQPEPVFQMVAGH
jgi:hypothetical protein